MNFRLLRRAAALAALVALAAPSVHAEPATRQASVPAAPAARPAPAASANIVRAKLSPAAHPSGGSFQSTGPASSAFSKTNARLRARAPSRVATPSLDVAISRADAREELRSVRAEVVRQVRAGHEPYVIFDIDDTLLSWPRPSEPRQEVPGALPYLASLKTAGAKIVYLTGRSKTQETETVAQLTTFGFPLGASETLLLKDTKERPTVTFKAEAVQKLVQTMKGKPVAIFDNEKENVRMFREQFPANDVAVIRPRTFSQRPDPGGSGPVTVVDDFRLAE